MSRRKSGFTLVELIVCFAILASIALSVSILMNSGTKLFMRENKRITLSYAQQAIVQIEEYFSDCCGVCKEGDTIYLTKYAPDSSGNKSLMLYSFDLDEDTTTLYLNESKIEDGAAGEADRQPVSNRISAFNVDYAKTSEGRITGVTIELTAKVDNTTYTKKKHITFMVDPIFVLAAESGTLSENLATQVWEAFEG